MLGKLLKYDLKWTYKLLIVFYLLAIIFSVLGRGLLSIPNSTIFSIIGQFCMGFSIAMIINALINNLIRVWVRFIRNIYKDESYLTHTLPVAKKTIYLSKVLAAIITMFTTILVILLSLAICFYSIENLDKLKLMLEIAANSYNSTVIGLLGGITIILFLEMVFALLSGYVGIILGHKSDTYKIPKSILYGFCAYFIPQILIVGIIFVMGFFNQGIMNLFITNNQVAIDALKIILYCGIIFYLISNFIFYQFGKRQLEKGVNID